MLSNWPLTPCFHDLGGMFRLPTPLFVYSFHPRLSRSRSISYWRHLLCFHYPGYSSSAQHREAAHGKHRNSSFHCRPLLQSFCTANPCWLQLFPVLPSGPLQPPTRIAPLLALNPQHSHAAPHSHPFDGTWCWARLMAGDQ